MSEFLIYLAVYLALGVQVAYFTRLALESQNWKATLLVLPLWPLWVLVLAVAMILKSIAVFQSRSCVWCGEVIEGGGVDNRKIESHMRKCQKHPLMVDLRRYQEALQDIDHGPVGYWNEPQHAKEVIREFMRTAHDALYPKKEQDTP